jgi:hypothetical protein
MRPLLLTILLLSVFTPFAISQTDDSSQAATTGTVPSSSSSAPEESGSRAARSKSGGVPGLAGSDKTQSTISDSEAPQFGDQPSSANSNTPWLPNAVNGEVGRLAFVPEMGRVNLLSAGVNFGSSYDDNTFSNNANPVGNLNFMVTPNISIQESRVRTLWGLAYTPGFAWNQRLSSRNETNHNLDFNFQYRITERLTTRIRDTFNDSTTSYDRIYLNPVVPGGNLLYQPNQSVVTPLAKRLSNLVDLDLLYQLGELTTIAVSGNFNKLHFHDAENNGLVQLIDSETGGGQVSLMKRLSGRHSIGVTYNFEKIASLAQIRDHTTTQSVLGFYTIDLKPHVTLSLFAGPDRTITNDRFTFVLGPFLIPVSTTDQRWLVDEGATFAWQGMRNSISANFIHHVSDGGGLVGAVQTYTVNAGVRRQFASRWTGDVGLSYGNNDPLSSLYGNSFSAITASAGFQKSLGERLSVGLRYARSYQAFQNTARTFPGSTNSDHNQAYFTISYQFTHPLGR